VITPVSITRTTLAVIAIGIDERISKARFHGGRAER